MSTQKDVTYYHGGFSYTVWRFTPKGIINVTDNSSNKELSYTCKEMKENKKESTLHREYVEWEASLER